MNIGLSFLDVFDVLEDRLEKRVVIFLPPKLIHYRHGLDLHLETLPLCYRVYTIRVQQWVFVVATIPLCGFFGKLKPAWVVVNLKG
tara:strand:+ start:460 stop:717 length:258 start_codon:yes stop_codon:yes gene_type:complete